MIEEQTIESLDSLFDDELKCESSIHPDWPCSKEVTHRLYHSVCGDPPKNLCAVAVKVDTMTMQNGETRCKYCSRKGKWVLCGDCWTILPI